MNKKSLYIIISVIILSTLMNLIDLYINPIYHIRTIIKIILFLLIPLIYYFIFKGELKDIKQLFIPKKKDFLKSLILGIFIYISIISCYFLLRNIVDFNQIAELLTSEVGVDANNLIYVTSYIAFFNSLLEEFFFRGFAFITLKKQTNRKFAYIFSASLFSIYHAGMTTGWFNPIIFILVLIALFLAGFIFNYLNEKCNHIYPSWLVHMFANFSINTVGFILFDIL